MANVKVVNFVINGTNVGKNKEDLRFGTGIHEVYRDPNYVEFNIIPSDVLVGIIKQGIIHPSKTVPSEIFRKRIDSIHFCSMW